MNSLVNGWCSKGDALLRLELGSRIIPESHDFPNLVRNFMLPCFGEYLVNGKSHMQVLSSGEKWESASMRGLGVSSGGVSKATVVDYMVHNSPPIS